MSIKEIDFNSKTAKIMKSVAAFFVMVIVVLWYIFFSATFHTSKKVYVYIDDDDTPDSVIAKVRKKGDPSSIASFMWLIKTFGYKVHAGRYAIAPGSGTLLLYHRLATGHQTPLEFSLNNIRTKKDLAESISRQLMMKEHTIESDLNDPAFCSKYGFTPETIICMFIPNTYQFYWNIKPKTFFKRMKDESDKFWADDNRLEKAKEIGYTPEQVMTIASIVEEETNSSDEKSMIAGVYINRLHKGMKLQSDPTIRFALQDFTIRRVGGQQLHVNSPYNTYVNQGLPPGPIRIPSIEGVDDVLHYVHHDYIYMCAKEDFSGTHNFAATWQEHEVNAKKYQQALNARNIKL